MILSIRRESFALCLMIAMTPALVCACGESGGSGDDAPAEVELSQEELSASEIGAVTTFTIEALIQAIFDLVNVPEASPIAFGPETGQQGLRIASQPLTQDQVDAVQMVFEAATSGARCQFSASSPEEDTIALSFSECAYGDLAIDGSLSITVDAGRGGQSLGVSVSFDSLTINGRTIDGTASGTVEASAREGEVSVTLSTEGDLVVTGSAGTTTLSLELSATLDDQVATTSGSGSAQLDGTTYAIAVDEVARDFDGSGADSGSITVTVTDDAGREVNVELRFDEETEGGAEVIVNGRSLGTLSYNEICQLIAGESCPIPSD